MALANALVLYICIIRLIHEIITRGAALALQLAISDVSEFDPKTFSRASHSTSQSVLSPMPDSKTGHQTRKQTFAYT